jgi:outer membrane protein OmpA-like peptidoglycan-associated protein
LSEKRSQSCVNYILNQGISSSQIIAKGFGETRLKNRCANSIICSEKEHQDNRRTELYIKLTKTEVIDPSFNLKLKD